MKLTVAVVLLVLGLASASTLEALEVENSISDDLFDVDDLEGDDLFDNDDFDIEINDDLSLDEARVKWRLLRNMYYVIKEMEQRADGIEKRSIKSFFRKIKEKIVKAAKKVGGFFKNTFNKAKATFKKIVKKVKISFKATVKKLIPHIHSGMTVAACTTVCTSVSAAVLGPVAILAGVVCGPVCNGALATIEAIAG